MRFDSLNGVKVTLSKIMNRLDYLITDEKESIKKGEEKINKMGERFADAKNLMNADKQEHQGIIDALEKIYNILINLV